MAKIFGLENKTNFERQNRMAGLVWFVIGMLVCMTVTEAFSNLPKTYGLNKFPDISSFEIAVYSSYGSSNQHDSVIARGALTSKKAFGRRDFLEFMKNNAKIGSAAGLLLISSPAFSNEEEKNDVKSGGSLLSAEEIATKLRVVPTFTIVDKSGAPYAVVGEDAKLSTYFFTTFDEAKRILTTATKSFDKTKANAIREENTKRSKRKLPNMTPKDIEDEFGKNPWAFARISSITMDVAISLSIKASGKRTGSYFFVQPAEDDVQDSLEISKDNKKELAEGKVPLFYMEDLKLPAENTTPVYFQKSQLIREWKRQNPQIREKDMPEILVSELFAVIFEMAKEGGSDEELKTIVFVPPENSKEKAKECNKLFEGSVPFKLGERIIVL